MRLVIGAALVLLGACSDGNPAVSPPVEAVNDAGVPDATPVMPAQACTTLPRSFTLEPASYFHLFASEAAAVSTMRAILPQRAWRGPGSAEQKRAQEAAAKVFTAYQELYPAATEGLDVRPVVVVQETPSPNAFVIANRIFPEPSGRRTALYLVVFTSGYITGATDAELAYVAAHEMGHLLLRNGDADYFKPTHYMEQTNLFGEYETNDPAAETIAREIGLLGDRVGQLTDRELNGYATDVGTAKTDRLAGPRYGRYLRHVHEAKGLTGPKVDDCNAATKKAQQISTVIYRSGHLSRDQSSFDLGTDGPKLDALTKEYWQLESSCLAHVTSTYRELVTYAKRDAGEDPSAASQLAAIGNDAPALDAYLEVSALEAAADAASPTQNIALKVAALGVQAQEQLRIDFADPKVKQIRVFTPEDDADSAAVRIGKILKLDATARVTKLLSTEDADYVADCNEKLASDVMPNYGGFIDIHHGTCWRAYRANKLAAALDTCAPTWPKP